MHAADSGQQAPGSHHAGLGQRAILHTDWLLWIIALGSWVAWWWLYRWYGLFANEHNTHFAFEKIPGWFDSPILRRTFALFILIGIAYALAIWLVRLTPATGWSTRGPILALIIGPAVANLALYPVGALDVFNYMIELKLAFHYDQNPYLVTFEAYRADPYALPAFLVDITLFYGPAWLAASWLPVSIAGFERVLHTLLALKLFNLALLGLTAWLIARYQDDRRRGWGAAAFFIANPLVLFEGLANAHNDVLMTAFLIGAIFALRRRSPLAGPLLALAALVKLNPLILAPLFVAFAARERWGWRRAGQTLAMTLLAITLVSAPWWGGGQLIDGLRSGLEESQEMDHVSLYSLAKQSAQEREARDAMNRSVAEFIRSRPSVEVVPERTLRLLENGFGATLVLLSLLVAAAVWKGAAVEPAAAATMLLLALLGTNLYAWYLIPIFALIALRIDRIGFGYVALATILGLAYYPMYVYAHFTSAWSRFEVHQFLALFLTLPALGYLVVLSVRALLSVDFSRPARAARPAPTIPERL